VQYPDEPYLTDKWTWREEAIAEMSDVMGLLLRRHFDGPDDFLSRVEAFVVAFKAKWSEE